jgi:hypothetical protein
MDGVLSLRRAEARYAGIRGLLEGAYSHEHDYLRHAYIEGKSGEIRAAVRWSQVTRIVDRFPPASARHCR